MSENDLLLSLKKNIDDVNMICYYMIDKFQAL